MTPRSTSCAASLAGPLVARLAAHPAKRFADEIAWTAHLAALGFDRLDVTLDPVRVATEGVGVSFFQYLRDRPGVPGAITIPPLPDLVRQALQAT